MTHKTSIQIQAEAQEKVAAWNTQHTVGVDVLYVPVMQFPIKNQKHTKTRSEAWVLSGHTAVIMLDGISGCVCLDACTPIPF
jgi:hypothetical protein